MRGIKLAKQGRESKTKQPDNGSGISPAPLEGKEEKGVDDDDRSLRVSEASMHIHLGRQLQQYFFMAANDAIAKLGHWIAGSIFHLSRCSYVIF